jgi:hypothetical protein
LIREALEEALAIRLYMSGPEKQWPPSVCFGRTQGDVQSTKAMADERGGQEIDRDQLSDVIVEKCAPSLRRRLPSFWHYSRDRKDSKAFAMPTNDGFGFYNQ